MRENGPDFPTGGIPSYNGSTKSFIRSLQNGMTMIRVWHSFKPVSAYGLSTIYTMGRELWDQTFPSKEFQAEFFRFMSETFKSTPWSVSIDAASSEYTPLEADASLRNLKFGVFGRLVYARDARRV